MPEVIASTSENEALLEQGKVISLFQFIKELNKLKRQAILNLSEYSWSRTISSFPDDPENISVYYRDRVENEEPEFGDKQVLLSVHKPEYDRCPQPDNILNDWLEPGWDSFRKEAVIKDSLPVGEKIFSSEPVTFEKDTEDHAVEYFTDSEERKIAYDNWLVERTLWVERQKTLQQTRSLFSDLYRLYFELQRDSETMELVVANGILCDRENSAIKHPVLTKRVKLRYDPTANTIFIEETDTPSELYSIVFQTMDDINLGAINQLQADLQNNDYHPLDRNDTPDFLKVLVHQLSADSKFSENGIPENWKSSSRLLLYVEPCYIMRKRLDGTLKAIEQIIENVQEEGYIPAPIRDIVSGGKVEVPEDTGEESIEQQLAAVGGESVDILLSKEANKEQLEIAKRIEAYNAVLVQGPPGTGKTHTIANLLGHFLAQGKSVLVTSQTPKALNVLKEKIAPGLQNLCVSVLEDSNVDMERSIDGITDYMSSTTSHELKREMDHIAQERRQIISDLAAVRRKIFQIIHQESNCIVYNGEEISPSKAASFVLEHTEDLSYIPGKVRTDMPLPLSFAQLSDLYQSNEGISALDEEELAADLPDPSEVLSPTQFTQLRDALQRAQKRLQALDKQSAWSLVNHEEDRQITFLNDSRTFTIAYPAEETLSRLKEYVLSFGQVEAWMKGAAVDGKQGGAYRQRWVTLIEQIQNTCDFAESIVTEQFGQEIHFAEGANIDLLTVPFEKMRELFIQKGKLPKLTLMLNKDIGTALECVTVNGKPVQSAKECEIILHSIHLEGLRRQCGVYWDELLCHHGVPRFRDLDAYAPERIAYNWIPGINRYLDWYQDAYAPLVEKLEAVGVPAGILFSTDPLDSDLVATDKILAAVSADVSVICDMCSAVIEIEKYLAECSANQQILKSGKRFNSQICRSITEAAEYGDTFLYAEAFSDLERMHSKYILQNHRSEMLRSLAPIAPQWADSIQTRQGVHGEPVVPDTIEDAWKWKQLSGIIEEMTKQPFSELQAESIRLSKAYRKTTAAYAEKSAWYHLLKATEGDIDMRHALQGWKQTVKKIGKGTGKNAPTLKAKARELMSRCQTAVPAWIMPINRALESLNPKENRFDLIIIDEASQSDVSSMAILYMGKKLIIVGDDKQVSPMAVGVEVDKLNALQQMYIQDKIPNAHLYDGKTSIYDIAKTTFQPLMLREHFRCVPEIIGFSNMLSYDYKIKPLRDASNSTLLPAVVNYRVADGQRLGVRKTNPNEAKAIVALMQACMEQPEYRGKTFGVISLLGNEQVEVIQKLIEENIDHKELISRNILCGNPSNFQGDERDVVFLSMVDSGTGDGPVRLQQFGPDDAYRKRYNVAASRAKDQLWVVDSLDTANDLKPGDIRKTLIEYSLNPNAFELKQSEIEEKADSPFEVSVATALVSRGYHLVQQWQVGAYRLDMVAVCGKKTVAIECDGERYHSGEAKIREDMERQTILERLGWRFIRIRGSEYFRNPEKAIDRVLNELANYGIEPEGQVEVGADTKDTELLNRVKARAAVLLSDEITADEDAVDIQTIAAALNTKSMAAVSAPNTTVQTEQAKPKQKVDVPSAVTQPQSAPKSKGKPVSKKKVDSSPAQKKVLPTQQVLPGMEDMLPNSSDVISLIEQSGVPYVDKRKNNGSLWIIGGEELSALVAKCNESGAKFTYKPDGGRATKGKPGWWAK